MPLPRQLPPLRAPLALWLGILACQIGCEQRTPEPADTARPRARPAPAEQKARASFESSKVEYTGPAMGTNVSFVAYTRPGLDEARMRTAFDAALVEVERLEKLMSSWRSDSEVSKLNAAPGTFVSVSPETLQVVQEGIWAGSISDGTFDITFQALSPLWKFGDAGDENPRPPGTREVARLLRHVDYRKLEIRKEARQVKLGIGQQIGLGGIAKGYIVDAAARVLERAGVQGFLVRAGGDLYGAGTKPGGESWVAGIQDPRGNPNDYFALLELEDRAFSTAGDYARSYMYEGKRYHHIIDPRTGFPATACRSVTVWAKSALLADAVDDGVFILGPERGLELVESLADVGAVIVDRDNKVWVSRRLKGKLKLLHDPTPGP